MVILAIFYICYFLLLHSPISMLAALCYSFIIFPTLLCSPISMLAALCYSFIIFPTLLCSPISVLAALCYSFINTNQYGNHLWDLGSLTLVGPAGIISYSSMAP